MTKFTAQKLGDLLTREATNGRAARIAGYKRAGVAFTAVVHVEADDGSWFELDATDTHHAHVLADTMVRDGARGVSCRFLRGTNGRLVMKAFYLKFADHSGDGIDGAI